MTKAPIALLLFSCAGLLAWQSPDQTWPGFRGADGRGLASDTAKFPAEFGPHKALVWQIELPVGHGSPCVWNNRIYVTGFDAASKKIEVIAIDRKKGQLVWRRPIPAESIEKVHATSSPATSTPVTDGKRVYVYAGSYGLIAFNWDGSIAWQYPMGVATSLFGSGASPVLAGEVVVVTRDYPPDPFMVALNTKDGSVAWKAELVKSTQMGPRTAHSTPILWNGQIVLNRPGEVSAYSPQDGKRLWWIATASPGTASLTSGQESIYVHAPAFGSDTYSSMKLPPFPEALEKYDANKDGKLSRDEAPPDDLYIMKRAGVPDDVPGAHFTIKSMFGSIDFNRDGTVDAFEYNMMRGMDLSKMSKGAAGIVAIRPEGEGQLPPAAVQWAEPRGAPEVPTPLEYRGRVYSVNSGGVLTCIDAKSGKLVYRGRVNAPGAYMASPVAGGGKVFVSSVEGVVSVLGGGDTLEVLSNNDLGEPVYGTPALVDSGVYIRSLRHLWAFGMK